jgi:hypothetical protein
MLIKTEQEIEQYQRKLESLTAESKTLSANGKEKLSNFEKELAIVASERPRELIYSNDWVDKLVKLREEIDTELRVEEEKSKTLQQQEQRLKEEAEKINKILLNPELELVSTRIDRLNDLKGILNTLDEVLSNWHWLVERETAQDQFNSLDQHGITSRLDKTINEMFLERCPEYFRLVGKNEFAREIITSFDYRKRLFSFDKKNQNIISLSGGTASIMTVLSLASKKPGSVLGTVLLVDEFNDVAETLRNETFTRLIENRDVSFSFFAKPLDKSPLITRAVSIEG